LLFGSCALPGFGFPVECCAVYAPSDGFRCFRDGFKCLSDLAAAAAARQPDDWVGCVLCDG
jgi:hypothetical protein